MTSFVSALPVWPQGREREMNRIAGFRVVFDTPAGGSASLRITCATICRISFNGNFLGYGPARAPHGFARVDTWSLDEGLSPPAARNLIAIEVCGYNINTYYLPDQPSYLQAEIVAGDTVIASTGGEGLRFVGRILEERVQRTERYSAARGFSEVYRLREGYDAWRLDPGAPFEGERLAEFPTRELLPRAAGYPQFAKVFPVRLVSEGRIRTSVAVNGPKRDWTLTMIGPDLRGYSEEEIGIPPSIELQQTASADVVSRNTTVTSATAFAVAESAFCILDFGKNLTGFIGCRIRCSRPIRLFMTFDEVLTEGEVDFLRLRCVNIILLELQPGTVRFEAFEPSTLRYLKVFPLNGPCEVTDLSIREYADDGGAAAQFSCSDERLNAIFEAGRETFRQNAVDIFTDCPSRERAGWLCDSFFLGRVAGRLHGSTTLERTYLENYLLPPSFAGIPQGMVPMCYPADHDNGNFIPNWALWLILQLEEYRERSGDNAMIEAFRPRVMGILDYFRPFRNEEGLLEGLKGWVFVEWSMANEFVQDVNYPTNMLFAAAARAAGRLYEREDLIEDGDRVAAHVREQSFDGSFFVDNALRKGGKLKRTENRTEICQYHAFYFGVATPETHPGLWHTLISEFGPLKRRGGSSKDIHPANALLGVPMRLELLSRHGLIEELLSDAIATYLPMARRTGTLWEHMDPTASCNHGFASHVAYLLYRDLLGLQSVRRKHVELRLSESGLRACRGVVPTPDGPLRVAWESHGEKVALEVGLPDAYTIHIDNRTGRHIIPTSLFQETSPPGPPGRNI